MKTCYFQIIAVICSAFLFSACGPIYSNYYEYTPPRSDSGKQCITTCRLVREECRSRERRSYDSCQYRSQRIRRDCEARKHLVWDEKDRDWRCVANCHCPSNYCSSPDFDSCEEDYRECYQDCGGLVAQYTRCVANCDQERQPTSY